MDQKIIEKAKKKLSLSYIIVRPNIAQNNENIDEILAFGSQNIMQIYKDRIKANSLDDLQSNLTTDTETALIEYTDEQILQMVNQVDESAYQIKIVDGNEPKINKTDFISGFKFAQFTVVEKREAVPAQMASRRRSAKTGQPLPETRIWEELFKNVFGDEEEELAQAKRREQARLRRQKAILNVSFTESEGEGQSSDEESRRRARPKAQQPQTMG